MFGGSETVKLRSGGTLRCGDLFVELKRGLFKRDRIELDRPSAGVGGYELVASPDERFAALFVFSGQTEAGYELFELEPTLRHVGGLPYVHGEGLAPLFSPDSHLLALVTSFPGRVRGSDDQAEDVLDPDADGDVLLDWATVHYQALPDGDIRRVDIGTSIPRSTDPDDVYAWNVYEQPTSFVSPNRLSIPLPWGGYVEIDLPAAGPITTPPLPS